MGEDHTGQQYSAPERPGSISAVLVQVRERLPPFRSLSAGHDVLQPLTQIEFSTRIRSVCNRHGPH